MVFYIELGLRKDDGIKDISNNGNCDKASLSDFEQQMKT